MNINQTVKAPKQNKVSQSNIVSVAGLNNYACFDAYNSGDESKQQYVSFTACK